MIGGIAQLGERLHGMQEVSSSILLTSTNGFDTIFDVNGYWISPQVLTPSSRGLGHHPFTVSTGVRIPVGSPSFVALGSQEQLEKAKVTAAGSGSSVG